MSKDTDIKAIMGANIARFRKEAGYSQEKFAELLSISLSTLSKIETGRNMPKPENIEKICAKLKIEFHQLFLTKDIEPKIKPEENVYEKLIRLIEENKSNSLFIEALYRYCVLLKRIK